MTKVNKNIEEVADYLEANGYLRSNNRFFDTKFIKDDKAVIIYADKVSFRNYSADGNEPEFCEYASFEGINILNTVDWIYLFHITGVVTLKSFIKNVKHGNSEAYNGIFPALVKATRKIAMFLTALALMLATTATAQPDAHIRVGYSTKTVDGFIAAGIGYLFKGPQHTGVRISTDLIVNWKQDASADAGLNLGIKYKGFEFGPGLYYMAYSVDKYDSYKNHFAPGGHIKYNHRRWNITVQYLEQIKIGFGVKEFL